MRKYFESNVDKKIHRSPVQEGNLARIKIFNTFRFFRHFINEQTKGAWYRPHSNILWYNSTPRLIIRRDLVEAYRKWHVQGRLERAAHCRFPGKRRVKWSQEADQKPCWNLIDQPWARWRMILIPGPLQIPWDLERVARLHRWRILSEQHPAGCLVSHRIGFPDQNL